MQNSQRPRRIVKPFASEAGSGYVRTVPTAAATGGAASYEQGFPPETFQPIGSGGIPPSGADVNGVLLDMSANARAFAAGMPAMFDADFASAVGGYPKYALVASTTVGRLWQATADNVTTDPDADPTGWAALVAPAGTTTGNYERRTSGILEQWGTVLLSSNAEPVVPVSLYQPYTDGQYNIALTALINAPSKVRDTVPQIIISTIGLDSFSVQYQNMGASGTSGIDGFHWRTIGR